MWVVNKLLLSPRYARIFEGIYSLHSLVMVVSAGLMIVVCLLVLVNQFWFVGFAMIAVGLWQVFFICQFGTAYETSCQQLEDKTYALDWYLLTPKHRRQWWLVLQMAQRPFFNTMAGIWPSNLNTFIRVRERRMCRKGRARLIDWSCHSLPGPEEYLHHPDDVAECGTVIGT